MQTPRSAIICARQQESKNIFTLKMQFVDATAQRDYSFQAGQFNMVSLPGVGEIALSIVSDPQDTHSFAHTIRQVGRVSDTLAQLQVGDYVGIRGALGRGWPVASAQTKNVLVVTGGLGCAPTVSVIHYILRRRDLFGKLTIIQGLKHSEDIIWRKQYEYWSSLPDVTVRLAADVAATGWPWHVGRVTELFDKMNIEVQNTLAMMCGPEPMMIASAQRLGTLGMDAKNIYLSLERNMQCGIGQCGHCQLGPWLICKQGPVFPWDEVGPLLHTRGY